MHSKPTNFNTFRVFNMRINLIVPYVDKDKVKKLGARWDGITKEWYIRDLDDISPFMPWFKGAHLKPIKK